MVLPLLLRDVHRSPIRNTSSTANTVWKGSVVSLPRLPVIKVRIFILHVSSLRSTYSGSRTVWSSGVHKNTPYFWVPTPLGLERPDVRTRTGSGTINRNSGTSSRRMMRRPGGKEWVMGAPSRSSSLSRFDPQNLRQKTTTVTGVKS